MKKAVTVCDSCGRVIRDGSDHFPVDPKRLLDEYQTRYESNGSQVSQQGPVIDLCYLCASSRLIPALEEIARSLASKAEKPHNG